MSNLKSEIDHGTASAKSAAHSAGKAVQHASRKLGQQTKKLARKIKNVGHRAGKKLGA